MLGKILIAAAASAATMAGWDISTASYNGILAQFDMTGSPAGIFFKPDGTKMYVVNAVAQDVQEYDLSTAWVVSTASYVQNFSVAAKETGPTALFFKSDGTEFYVGGNSSDSVHQYSLSTAWDVSSASFTQSFSAAAQDGLIQGLCFGSSGTRMYVSGFANDSVYQYNLSTAWDISTASYSKTLNVSVRASNPTNLVFDTTGTKLYINDSINDQVDYWTLSSAWEIDTATYSSALNVLVNSENPFGIAFKSDGTKLFVVSRQNDNVTEYQLSTAWDIDTAVFKYALTEFLYVGLQTASPRGLTFKPDGSKLFITSLTDDIFEYTLSTPWNIDTASFSQSFDLQSTQSDLEGHFFRSDGLKMYTVGSGVSAVREFDLSVAWDISTLNYQQNFIVNSEETSAEDLFFSTDGSRMYVLGSDSDAVHEYALSTAWDISTASFTQSFSVATQETVPVGLFFRPTGATMFVIGTAGDDVNEYSLSTPWDVSTASYVQNFSVQTQDDQPQDVAFKNDGSKMYIVAGRRDGILSYDI